MPSAVENMPGNLDSEDNILLEYDDEDCKSKQANNGDDIQEAAHESHERPIDGHPGRRSIVDELLTEIYSHRRYAGPYRRRLSSTPDESDHSTSPDSSAGLLPTNRRRFTDTSLQPNGIKQLKEITEQLQEQIKNVWNHLVRQLIRRDHLFSKRDRQYDFLTAFLQAASPKRGVDTRMKFSVEPRGGDTGFMQWHDAMKMVARLPGGIPADFRKRLWLTMADKHLQNQRVDWAQAQRVCFNERSNPDDDELGTQIVKDLHRTGCSLFCGEEAEHNQALLKRVLLAYARWNKTVGYCQGFNMLAALILEVTEWCEENALKVMIYLIEGVLPESYFANNLRGLSVDMAVFRDLLRLRLPNLSRHLDTLQAEARESASGASYEPPLTNVFTMQWFLTLFSNCLPKSTVLRVWDLIFLEGNEVLLRTALAIWDGIADRIMTVESADEFYSIMHVLTREMLEFGLMDANYLVKTICMMAPFPFPQLAELRDKYTYNITPFTAALGLAKRAGYRFFHSDDEEDDDEQQMAVAAWCFSSVLPHQVAAIKAKAGEARERSASIASSSSSGPTNFTVLGPGAFGPSPPAFSSSPPAHHHSDSDRMTLDISALKKQYAKLRERQKQAHIILTGECKEAARLPQPAPNRPPSIAVNHLLVGKKPLTSKRGQMQKGGTIHLVMQNKPGRREAAPKPRAGSSPPPTESGETLQWKEAKQERRASLQNIDITRLRPTKKEGAVSSSSSSSSSSSTELCDDDQGTLSDFDSDEDVSTEIPKIVPPISPQKTRAEDTNSPVSSKDKLPPSLELLGSNNNDTKQWDHLSPSSMKSQAESATSSGLTSGPDQEMSLSSSESDLKSEETSFVLKETEKDNLDFKGGSVDSVVRSEKEISNLEENNTKSSDNSPSERSSSLVDTWLKTNGKMFANEIEEVDSTDRDLMTTKNEEYLKNTEIPIILEGEHDEVESLPSSTASKSHVSDEVQSFYSVSGSYTGSSYMCEEDRNLNMVGSFNDDNNGESDELNQRLQNFQTYWMKEFENQKSTSKGEESSDDNKPFTKSCDTQGETRKDFSYENNSDERFKKYILESSSKFLEQEICNSSIKRNGFSTETYKWSELNETDKDSTQAMGHPKISDSCCRSGSFQVQKDEDTNSQRLIPRRMSCTDLPEVNSFVSGSRVDWFLNKDSQYETSQLQEDSEKTAVNEQAETTPSHFQDESHDFNKPYINACSTDIKEMNCSTDEESSFLSSFLAKSTKYDSAHCKMDKENASILDSSDSSDRSSQVLPDPSRNDHLSEIASLCSQMQRSFGHSLTDGLFSSQNHSNFSNTVNSSSSIKDSEESDKTVFSKTTASCSSVISNSINNHPVANCEPKCTKNLVGNISLRTPVTPITFNPFPTSRKSPSKLPTEIGVKLGLYDPNSAKTEKALHSPSKSSSPTKRKFYW